VNPPLWAYVAVSARTAMMHKIYTNDKGQLAGATSSRDVFAPIRDGTEPQIPYRQHIRPSDLSASSQIHEHTQAEGQSISR